MYADDIKYLEMALREAEKAAEDGEVPTGCVIVDAEGRILGRAHNQTEGLQDATAHAEMLALSAAFAAKGAWRLTGTRLYVTKEPCAMCAGAAGWTQIGRIVYGAADEKRGFEKIGRAMLHPKTEITSGVLEEECATLMRDFFKEKR